MKREMKHSEIQSTLALKHEDHFREALDAGFIEMTILGKPRSRLQKTLLLRCCSFRERLAPGGFSLPVRYRVF